MKENKKEVIGKFKCYGEIMVIVRLDHAAHVMTLKEWEWIKKQEDNYNKRRRKIA